MQFSIFPSTLISLEILTPPITKSPSKIQGKLNKTTIFFRKFNFKSFHAVNIKVYLLKMKLPLWYGKVYDMIYDMISGAIA